jgi:hypothetical protein
MTPAEVRIEVHYARADLIQLAAWARLWDLLLEDGPTRHINTPLARTSEASEQGRADE